LMMEFNAADLAKDLMKLAEGDLDIVHDLLCSSHFENASAAYRADTQAFNTHRMLNRSYSCPE